VRAALEGAPERVYRAAMLDRHAASVLSIKEIRAMVDDLIAAHGNVLPEGIRPGRGSSTSMCAFTKDHFGLSVDAARTAEAETYLRQ
jgi:hypothetical protein